MLSLTVSFINMNMLKIMNLLSLKGIKCLRIYLFSVCFCLSFFLVLRQGLK